MEPCLTWLTTTHLSDLSETKAGNSKASLVFEIRGISCKEMVVQVSELLRSHKKDSEPV